MKNTQNEELSNTIEYYNKLKELLNLAEDIFNIINDRIYNFNFSINFIKDKKFGRQKEKLTEELSLSLMENKEKLNKLIEYSDKIKSYIDFINSVKGISNDDINNLMVRTENHIVEIKNLTKRLKDTFNLLDIYIDENSTQIEMEIYSNDYIDKWFDKI